MAKTIVLADDSSTMHKIVELTFRDSGIRVEHVMEGATVIDRTIALRADLLLVDVALPGGPSGYEICRGIKASRRPIPVLLLGGTFERFDAELGRACGADGQLIKPFEPDVLRAKVEDLLAGAGAVSASPPRRSASPGGAERPGSGPAAAAPARRPAAATVSPELVDAVARAVVERLSDRVVREIAREVVPDLAASIIRERIRELEREDPD